MKILTIVFFCLLLAAICYWGFAKYYDLGQNNICGGLSGKGCPVGYKCVPDASFKGKDLPDVGGMCKPISSPQEILIKSVKRLFQ